MQRLTTSDLMRRLGIRSRETLRQRKSQPDFPKPIHDPGSPVNYYLEEEVNQYVRRLTEARDGGRAAQRQELTAA